MIGRLTFLTEVLVPLLLLPVFTPWFAFALPGLVEVLSSRWSITYTMGQHYAGVWIAYVLAAFAVAASTIAQQRPGRALNLVRASAAVCVLVARAFNRTYGLGLSTREEVDAAYAGERRTGSACGRMDQVCAFGQRAVALGFDGMRYAMQGLLGLTARVAPAAALTPLVDTARARIAKITGKDIAALLGFDPLAALRALLER